MRADVLLGESLPTPSEVAGRVVVVIDVLRASTTIVQALASGARAVMPLADVDDVLNVASRYGRSEVLLAGERRALPIAGFDVGNSPAGMTSARVQHKTVLFTTTNGTAALLATHGARHVYVAGFTNMTATLSVVAAHVAKGMDVLLVCAGQDRRVALEDAACAGVLLKELLRKKRTVTLGDAALLARQLGTRYGSDVSRIARDAAHARTLLDAGFAADVDHCLARDHTDVVATYADRQVTTGGS